MPQFKHTVVITDSIGREQNHLKLILQKDGKCLEALFFNFTREPHAGESIDLVFFGIEKLVSRTRHAAATGKRDFVNLILVLLNSNLMKLRLLKFIILIR